jgi:hypothetical protein
VLVVAAMLATWSVAATLGVGIQYQRMYGPILTLETRQSFVGTQLDVHDAFGGGAVSHVSRGATLPPVAPAGEFFVVGDCDGLYWSDGRAWRPIDETPLTGRHRLRVRLPDVPPGTVEPLLMSGTGKNASILRVRTLRDDRVRFEYEHQDPASSGEFSSRALRLDPDRTLDLDVRFDPVDRLVEVRIDGEQFFVVSFTVEPGPVSVGAATIDGHGSEAFSGRIRERASQTEVCDRLVDRNGQVASGSSS